MHQFLKINRILLILLITLCAKYANAQDDIRNIDVGHNNDNNIHYTYDGRKIRLRGVPDNIKKGYEYWWNNQGRWYQGEYHVVGSISSEYVFYYLKNSNFNDIYHATITFDSGLTENIDICKGDVKVKELIVNTSLYIGTADTYEWYEWVNNSWESRGSNSTYTVSIPEDNKEIDGATMIYRCLASNASGTVEKLFNITPRALIATSQISRY